MQTNAQIHDLGGAFALVNVGAFDTLAGGGEDNVEQSSIWVDRTAPNFAISCVSMVSAEMALADGIFCTIASNMRDADDASGLNAADFPLTEDTVPVVISPDNTVITGATATPIQHVVHRDNVLLKGARQFVQIQWTITLSSGSVDLVQGSAGFAFNDRQQPPTESAPVTSAP